MKEIEKLFVHEPLYSCIAIVLSIVLSFILSKVANYFIKTLAKKVHKGNGILFIFIRRVVTIIIYVLGVFAAFEEIVPLRNIGTALLGVSSVFTVVIALGAQEVASDLISGILISSYQPFEKGDFITLPAQGISGTVKDLNMHHCKLLSPNNTTVIVPNKLLNSAVIENRYAHDGYRLIYLCQIAYDADRELAKKIVLEYLANDERVTNKDELKVVTSALKDSAVELKVVIMAQDFVSAKALEADLNDHVLDQFKEKDIKIPYPHLTITK